MTIRNARLESILYGNEHQKLRKKLKPFAVGQKCTRCSKVIEAGQSIDLDHYENSTQYRGWAHSSCNRRAGVQHGNAMRANATPRDPAPVGRTQW